jgi:hypothetical protein
MEKEMFHLQLGTKKSTTSSKSREIKEMLNLDYWDSEFSTKHMKDNNPLADLVMFMNL